MSFDFFLFAEVKKKDKGCTVVFELYVLFYVFCLFFLNIM